MTHLQAEGAIARQIRLHQEAIDRDFPHGAVASWLPETDTSTVYAIAWIQVTGMSGLDPVLKLYIDGADRILDDMVATAWVTRQEKPLIIEATFENVTAHMQLAADVPERMAVLMDLAREQLAKANPLPV